MIDILLPTYHRPHALVTVMDNIRAATKNPHTLYFGVEKDDSESIEAVRLCRQRAELNGQDVRLVVNQDTPGYSNTIQAMFEASSNPFCFHANDDFEFLTNWDEHPIAMFETPQVQVVGVPQNEADRSYSAICFFRRSYIEEQSGVIDIPSRVFYPYNHNYIDTEFTQTAQHRGVWFASSTPCINHLHPGFTGKEKDDTYKKNDATMEDDHKTFDSRKHLWNGV